jgi:hypothetical protein
VANFTTDTDLHAAAFGLAHSMLEMLDRDGVGPDVIGLPDQMDVDVFRRSFEVDAQLYMSMDPTRLADEYDEIRTAANLNGPSSDPHSIVQAAIVGLEANWHGKAADAFFEQMNRIQQRITTQHDYTLVAAEAVGMMYAVNVAFRNSCYDLMSKTAVVCAAIADQHAPQPTNWAKVIVDLVGKAIDVVSAPKDILGMAIDGILSGIGTATEDKPVAGTDALPVVNGYVEARDQLFTSYENSIGQVHEWIDARRREYAGLDETLPQPLPSTTDVDSPDFRYENFFYDQHANPGEYAPEVERERQRYVDEKAKPDGAIAQRLSGDR